MSAELSRSSAEAQQSRGSFQASHHLQLSSSADVTHTQKWKEEAHADVSETSGFGVSACLHSSVRFEQVKRRVGGARPPGSVRTEQNPRAGLQRTRLAFRDSWVTSGQVYSGIPLTCQTSGHTSP